MDFKVVYSPASVLTRKCTIASAVVVEAGDMVALSSGLIIKAVALSAAIGYAAEASPDGSTSILVVTDTNVIFEGTGDAVFAVTQKGTEVDLVGTTTQLIDVGASSTDVLKIEIDENAGTVGSTDNIRVRINKPL